MARIAGLSKQIAEMALQLMREGSPVDVALNSAARLSDATPQQVSFADDLLMRRAKAIENASPRVYVMGADSFGQPRSVGIEKQIVYRPGDMAAQKLLQRQNKSYEPNPSVNRISRTGALYAFGRTTALQAAENRLRAELAMAAAEGNPERMQNILVELGFLPDNAYNLAIRTLGL